MSSPQKLEPEAKKHGLEGGDGDDGSGRKKVKMDDSASLNATAQGTASQQCFGHDFSSLHPWSCYGAHVGLGYYPENTPSGYTQVPNMASDYSQHAGPDDMQAQGFRSDTPIFVIERLQDLQKQMSDLQRATAQLDEGMATLKEGTAKLTKSMAKLGAVQECMRLDVASLKQQSKSQEAKAVKAFEMSLYTSLPSPGLASKVNEAMQDIQEDGRDREESG
jgi:exonuclease VII small subunit